MKEINYTKQDLNNVVAHLDRMIRHMRAYAERHGYRIVIDVSNFSCGIIPRDIMMPCEIRDLCVDASQYVELTEGCETHTWTGIADIGAIEYWDDRCFAIEKTDLPRIKQYFEAMGKPISYKEAE